MPESMENTSAEPVTELPQQELPQGEQAAPAADAIRIGDKTFATQAEAFAYAQAELARQNNELAIAEAYRAGIADASMPMHNAPQAPAQPQDDPEWETKFYADPKRTLHEFATKIREEVKKEVTGEVEMRTEEQKLWAQFYQRHPDLEGFQEDAQAMLTKHDAELKALVRTKGQTAAFDYLAQKTRAKFQEYIERAKPRRTLPNTSAAPSPGTQTSVTPAAKPKPKVDFISQIRSLRK